MGLKERIRGCGMGGDPKGTPSRSIFNQSGEFDYMILNILTVRNKREDWNNYELYQIKIRV